MMMKKVTVLGGGMVGSEIANDLCDEYDVTVVDIDQKRLGLLSSRNSLQTARADLSDPDQMGRVISDSDLVIGAVPGFMGYRTLETVIESGKDIVDISFFDEDPFRLDESARRRNSTAIIDCGVAPGMSNVILGHHDTQMQVEYYECLVGGLPVQRTWPYQYKAPFSPIDVVEEYTRPARMVENGKIISKPALSDPEYVEIDPVGTLEAFNTDGLRTLLTTMNVPIMKEKTMRYPGHIEYMRVLLETGFFSKDPLDVGGVSVCPIDVTAKLIFPKWRPEEGDPDFTAMRVTVKGNENGTEREYVWNLFDRSDEKRGISSMARTTGYTCSSAARLILDGIYTEPGIVPPEYLGRSKECFDRLMSDLAGRGVCYKMEEARLIG
jgi:saccharopine dehydrogenase-like NADP-dependent oxidoreductase